MMRLDRVDYILRAAGKVTGVQRFVLIGSAAVIAWRSVVPPQMAATREVDLFAYDVADPDEVAEELDGAIGQASDFDRTFGYYCDGVGPETAILPEDWAGRARDYSSPATEGVVAIVPEPNDIALAKVCAWREKDVQWLVVAVQHAIVDLDAMRSRLKAMPERAGDLAALAERLVSLDRMARTA